jgi:hypothetical protein
MVIVVILAILMKFMKLMKGLMLNNKPKKWKDYCLKTCWNFKNLKKS